MSRESEIFIAASELASEAERRAFLDSACANDPQLRGRVEELLGAHEKVDVFFAKCTDAMESVAVEMVEGKGAKPGAALPGGPEDAVGSRIGPYRLLKNIGEGGCGAVYMAEQTYPVRRHVALKVIKLGMDTRNVIARFEAERQALALMDHPNIARVIDAGATDSGRPYFVMELVHGVRITEYCDTNRLTIRQRLKLFIQICHAIQHAHQKGLIHRDIKPSNILVTTLDGMPLAKVIDFGIAKAIEERLTEATSLTVGGLFIGTPAYMSPEQAQMTVMDVDTRSDIYSLGVLLYELLTGKTPFDQKELLAAGIDRMRRTLCEAEPKRPSVRLDSLQDSERKLASELRGGEPTRLSSELRGDLDWIVMKTLEKDRQRRYQTANGLAMDIERYLSNELVSARPPSVAYRLGKLVRRNKITFAAIGAVAVALVSGLGLSTFLFFREREARHLADRLRSAAENHEKLTQANMWLSRDEIEKADALVNEIEAPDPNLEYADLYRRLGNWNVSMNRWKEAANRFAVLGKVDQPEKWDSASLDYLRCGPALIEAGDLVGYERFREALVERFRNTTNLIGAERVIKTSLLLPANAQYLQSLEPLWLVASKFENRPDESLSNDARIQLAWRLFSLALMEYRRGHFDSCLNLCLRASKMRNNAVPREANLLVLMGLAHRALGQEDLSAAEIKKCRELVKTAGEFQKTEYWFDWTFPLILLREADAGGARH